MNNKHNERYLKAFGAHLRKVRKSKSMTMMQLAFEADVEYSQVAKIEKGSINTTISTVQALAEAMNLAPAELFQFSYSLKSSKK